MTDERDPYAILEIAAHATPEEVTAAYRILARRHHPDVSRASDAERRMAEINAAWSVLRDPARRAAWDRAHGITPLVARAGGFGARTAGPDPRRTASPSPGGMPRPTAGSPWPTSRPASNRTSTTWRRGPAGEGAAGPPPGNPRGSVLPFGRHIGWSLGEIARVDPGYLAWLQGRREGEPYRDEIARILEALRPAAQPDEPPRRRRFG